MGKLFLMTLNTMRSGYGTMLVLMRDRGAMTGPVILIGQGTLKGGGKLCRTGMHLLCRTKVSKVVTRRHHRMLHLLCRTKVSKVVQPRRHHRMLHHHRNHHPMQATREVVRHHPMQATREVARHHPMQAT